MKWSVELGMQRGGGAGTESCTYASSQRIEIGQDGRELHVRRFAGSYIIVNRWQYTAL